MSLADQRLVARFRGTAVSVARALIGDHDADPAAHASLIATAGAAPVAAAVLNAGAWTVPSGPASGFSTVLKSSSVSDGAGTWHASNMTWTPSQDGTYLLLATFRAPDSLAARSFGLGVHTSNIDGSWFLWDDLGGKFRHTRMFQRVMALTAGVPINFYVYNDAAATFTAGTALFSITRLGD